MFIALKRLRYRNIFKQVMIFINIVLILSILYFFTKESHQASQIEHITIKPLEEEVDFSCHYMEGNEVIPVISNNITFPGNSIFFIVSSCKDLTAVQACAVESAARANPDRQVNVLFTFVITRDKIMRGILNTLLQITNVEVARIQLHTYAERTPLHGKFRMKLTQYDLNMELTDILKYITLYKYDGVYLPLDVIVARSFDDLENNWVIKKSPIGISSDIFSFSNNKNGRVLADVALNLITTNLATYEKTKLWTYNSNDIMKDLMGIWCAATDVLFQNTLTCPDLQVIEPEFFRPIYEHDRKVVMKPQEWDKLLLKNTYIYQTWDPFAKNAAFANESLYGRLTQEYCPSVCVVFGNQFGSL